MIKFLLFKKENLLNFQMNKLLLLIMYKRKKLIPNYSTTNIFFEHTIHKRINLKKVFGARA